MKRTMSILVAGALAMTAGMAAQAAPARVERAGVAAQGSSGITAVQRAMLAEKLALASRILAAAGASQQGPQVTADQQRWLQESLYKLPLEKLRAMGAPSGFDAAARAIAQAKAEVAREGVAKLGQANTELVYYPITPCRYIDTRNVGGKIVGSRAYDLGNAGDIYGGSAACNPKTAVGGDENNMAAISMNVAIVDPSAFPGFLGARPVGSTNTTSLVNWYQAGAIVQASNAGIIAVDQSLLTEEIEFFGTTTHLIVDVFGVFGQPTSTPLQCVTGTLTQVGVNTTTRDYSLQASGCPTGYGLVGNSCNATGDVAGVRQAGGGVFTASDARCIGRYEGASAATIINVPWCCRIPGR